MTSIDPKMIFTVKAEPVVTKAYVPLYGQNGRIKGLRLIGMDGAERYYVTDQVGDELQVVAGPIAYDAAIDAVERVLGGRERSVTGDGLAAVAGVTARLIEMTAERDALLRRLQEVEAAPAERGAS